MVHPTPHVPKPTCTSPRTDDAGIYVSCDEGYTYRVKSDRCQGVDTGRDEASLPRVTTFVDCSADASVCDAYQYGVCESGGGTGELGCSSLCGSDADCEAGATCRCSGDGPGRCTYGDTCETDADCETGYHCASTSEGCGNTPFTCQSAQDKCFSAADCGGDFMVVCTPKFTDVGDQLTGARECGDGSVCGRPFLVLSEPRLPPVVTRTDWVRPQDPAVAHLTTAERAALAQHFSRLGQMEHASIAAFARFQLQLLALGAPPELVEACNRALADETAHARLCFGIASAYAGRALGPGPLDVQYSLEKVSLVDVVDLVIAEGCFGETRAALEALEAADNAQDPVIRAAYAGIADDEQRHAELAFRFVRWALGQEPDAVRLRIGAAIEMPPDSAALVAVPCLEALLAASRLAA